jgi:hypothetical protein
VIILAFLAILAYVLFSGDDKPRDVDLNPGISDLPPTRPSLGSTQSTSPTLAPDPHSASTAAGVDSPGSDGARAFTQNPDRWRDEHYDPSSLRSIPTTPASARSAVGWDKEPGRRTRQVQIPATSADEIVLTHRDDMMRGGGHGGEVDWKEWKANAIASGQWNPDPSKPAEHHKRYRIKQDIEQSRAKVLFAGHTLAPGMFRRICELERVARQDARGVTLPPSKWDKNGQLLPSDAASSLVEHTDDPMADNWDDVWGSLPVLGMRAAEQVARIISHEDINELARLMAVRQKASVTDSKRDWSAFVQRAAPDDGGKLDQARLTMGWFADTYRSVSHPARMCISHQFVNMMETIPRVANGLQWLEAMAWHLRRQRMFGPLGVDIHGLALRLAAPCTMVTERRAGANRYRYDLELHVFMWGGPKEGGEDGMRDWIYRLHASADCLRSARTDLVQVLYEFNEPDTAINSVFKRRRVIFRPGFTTFGVNNSTFDSVDRGKALRGVITRAPEVITYPDDFWSKLKYDVDDPMRRVLVGFYPHEVGIFNSRQYQWNTSTLTADNNRLNDRHLLAILRGLGPAMNPDADNEAGGAIDSHHTVEFLDFGSFVPLVRTREGVRFFPLDSMCALAGMVIPYLPAGGTKDPSRPDPAGATARILLDESYGIRTQLSRRKSSASAGRVTQDNLTVFVTVRSKFDRDKFRWDVTEYLQNAARRIIADAAPSGSDRAVTNAARREARKEMQGWIDKYISSVCIVDESGTSESNKLQGNLRHLNWEKLNIIGPDRWPTEFQDIEA